MGVKNNDRKRFFLIREFTMADQKILAAFSLSIVGLMGYLSSLNYLLFHVLIETFTIILGFCLIPIGFNNRHLKSQAIPILVIACAFTGCFDFLHALAYENSEIFVRSGSNLALQLWIIARYLFVIGLFLAGVSFYKVIKVSYIVIFYFAAAVSALFSIFYWNIFPDCWITGSGLTNFKINSDYVICLMLVAGLLLFIRNKHHFSSRVFQLLVYFYAFSICTRILMMNYNNLFTVATDFGYLFKSAALICLYCAVIESNVKEPYERLLSASVHIDTIPAGFYVLDNDWRFIYVNQLAKTVLFDDREHLTGKCRWDNCSHDEFLYKQYLKAKQENIMLRFEAKAGKDSWFEVFVYPSAEGMSIYFSDISDRKLLEAQVLEYHELLQEFVHLLELDPESLMICEMDDKITFWNNESERIYGFTRDEALGKIARELLKASFPMPLQEIYAELFNSGIWTGEFLHTTKDNKQITVRSCWLLRKDVIGMPLGIFKIDKDLTQERRIEEELADLGQMKLVSQIAAGISHEIRNPMTTVRGYLQLLSLKNDLSKYHPKFELMIEELDRANHIISEFLSLAKNKSVSFMPHDLNQTVLDLAPLLESDASSFGIVFNMSICEKSILVLLDKSKIRQLILNLVRNSFEAVGTNGRVTVMTYLDNEEGVLAIKDNGNGIPDEVLNKIGMPFISTKESGTGLGLSICYNIVEHHNAKIDVETGSEGTTFFIRFPLCKEI